MKLVKTLVEGVSIPCIVAQKKNKQELNGTDFITMGDFTKRFFVEQK